MRRDMLHLRAPVGWLNDPNGFIYYNGKYHLFYQHFPYAPVWGTMHWGHAVSDDLVHWEHLNIAIFPTKGYDKNGIFSGSAVEKDGRLYLYYTAVQYLEVDNENIHVAVDNRCQMSQALLISEDGIHFDNWKDKQQVIPTIPDYTEARDPKVWRHGNDWYLVLGSADSEDRGCLLFYRSNDGIRWHCVNRYQDSHYGRIIECPDIFQIDGQYVLTASSMYVMNDGLEYAHHAVCAAADFEEGSCVLQLPESYQIMDYGLDLYAAQTNLDCEGRRVMIAWMRMPEAVDDGRNGVWNGLMCLPRVVEVNHGHIYFRIHPEVDAFLSHRVSGPEQLDFSRPYRLQTVLHEGESLDIGGYLIRMTDGAVHADRSRVFPAGEKHRRYFQTSNVGEKCRLDIFVDRHIIEIFINSGEYVLSNIVYGLGDNIDGQIDIFLQ